MDVKCVGHIVVSFEELQKNKYWKHYYDLSLMLTNDKHSLIQDLVYNSNYYDPYIYKELRFWSINTAFIDGREEAKSRNVVENEYNCYYMINPFDMANMKPASQKDLDVYTWIYMSRYEVRTNMFDRKSIIYYSLAIGYQASLIEKELDELSTIFEDKKDVLNLVTLNGKEGMNGDVLRVIFNFLVSGEGHKKYKGIIDTIEECKNNLEMNAQILEA
jgi:hypothetical protein